jgi:hypothetical protein
MQTDRNNHDPGGGDPLRLIWPQWQGATTEVVADLLPEVPLEEARSGTR